MVTCVHTYDTLTYVTLTYDTLTFQPVEALGANALLKHAQLTLRQACACGQ
jgi:hypothetical protein